LFFFRRASASIVVSKLAGAADDGVELALAGELRQVTAELVEIGRAGRRLHAALLGTLAHDFGHLLAQRLRRQSVFAQNRRGQAFTFLGKADQQVLGTDIGMAEFVRGDEGPVQRVLQARTDADFALGPGLSTLRFLLNLAPQVVHIDLELFQDRFDDVGRGQC
jgi:hypothetical protein